PPRRTLGPRSRAAPSGARTNHPRRAPMSHHARATALLALLTLIGCAERRDAPNAPTIPVEPAGPLVSAPSLASQAERGRHERLARRLALALGEPGFRARVFQALRQSR